jgi:hypothetical protein
LQNGANIEEFKYLEKNSGIYLIYRLFDRGRATSKNGGGRRYDVILDFKGEQIKKFKRKKEREI